jgi:4-hydroxybenzoate polyprenyltransferase
MFYRFEGILQMSYFKSQIFCLYDRPIFQLMKDLRLHYAGISSSLVLLGFFWNDLKGFSWQYLALCLGIFFANVFGYIINDYYDASNDIIDRGKKSRNVFCSPNTKHLGEIVLYTSLSLTIFFGLIVSIPNILSIILLNILSIFYSVPHIRLRNRLFFDWIFVFIWKGLIIFTGYFYFSEISSLFNPFIFGTITIVMLLSLISQIDNQIRDFQVDKTFNINNSSQHLGAYNASSIKLILSGIFYTFSIIFCYIQSLYFTLFFIFLNLSLYLFTKSSKYRFIIEFSNIWIVILFLENFKTYFYQQQLLLFISITVILGTSMWKIKSLLN